MGDKLDFNDIIRRSGGQTQSKERQLPSELYQCVAFFGRPVLDELEVEFQKWQFLFRKKDLETLQHQRFIFPFYSKEVFVSQQEATNFLPYFVKRLIADAKLPQEVINEDKSINEDIVKLGIAPLTITMIEKDRKDE